WACRSRPASEDSSGQEVDDREVAAQAALRGPTAQPMRRLRTSARLHAALRAVPHLLPGARPRRAAAGRHQVELVARRANAAATRPHQRKAPAQDVARRTTAEENSTEMNSTDPIADMLTRIRNASLARHRELTL